MRVLQVGYGQIGKEIAADWAPRLHGPTHRMVEGRQQGVRVLMKEPVPIEHQYMVTDLVAPIPEQYEWDGGNVDLAVIVVNTPAAHGGGFDYEDLVAAVRGYLPHAGFILIRSTVSLDFLDHPLYRAFANRIGFAPEFYGATKWSRRAVLDMGFTIFTDNVPTWFLDAVGGDGSVLGTPAEVIVSKLAENAFLATKVTFFHELALACEDRGINPEVVRQIVTMDPRIGAAHSFMEEPGWESHCMDKDVPEYAHALDSDLVRQAILVNRATLLPARNR